MTEVGTPTTTEPGRSESSLAFSDSVHSTSEDHLKRDLLILADKYEGNDKQSVIQSLDQFQSIFKQFLQEKGKQVNWDDIKPPPEGMIKVHENIPEPTEDDVAEFMSKLVVLKLNGGLGTSMGCKGPKSVIEVRNESSFLDLTVMQIEHLNKQYKTDVPLVLMNSFNTETATAAVLRKYDTLNVRIIPFNQSMMPRLYRDSNVPAPKSFQDKDAWYPPGHGDLYRSLARSGVLDKLVAEGKEFLFVSNIDNLGSVVDTKILSQLATSESEFIMEVTDKTRADIKGGTLIDYNGQCRLLEVAQVPSAHIQDFKSITKFRIFNTNNLWMKLSAVKRLAQEDGLHMEVIENVKSMNGHSVIQLEQAVGSAIKNFRHAIGVNVPRSRFLPVKQSQDLMLVMSNLFTQNHGTLSMNTDRVFKSLPLVKLGNEFKKVSDFLSRFETIPNILELDHLTVSGDVHFGRGVTLRGTVIIIANEGERIDIPARSLLENKIVSGNLRILEH